VEKTSETGSLTGKRAFLKQHCCVKQFSDGKILGHISNPEFGDVYFLLKFYGDTRGVCQNMEKSSESSFLETAFSRAKCRLSGNKKFS